MFETDRKCGYFTCRLRQCCCHLNLLANAVKSKESDLDHLALEVAMGGLTLGGSAGDDQVDTPHVSQTVSLPRLVIFLAMEKCTMYVCVCARSEMPS